MQVEQLIMRAGKKPIVPGGLCGWTATVSTHNPVLWGLSTVDAPARRWRHAIFAATPGAPLGTPTRQGKFSTTAVWS